MRLAREKPAEIKSRPPGGTIIHGRILALAKKNVNQTKPGLSLIFAHEFMHFMSARLSFA
ncbi:hypothetical protein HED55_07620 [Ochrobactrum haematophilum]|uniref:Uncharacterized protein n=1 Tax=Brucella haematophila TaxID=419474 RepID=A0ABX1DMM1_9HYPH|nr:hypothetical protein [Brucella haematophila]